MTRKSFLDGNFKLQCKLKAKQIRVRWLKIQTGRRQISWLFADCGEYQKEPRLDSSSLKIHTTKTEGPRVGETFFYHLNFFLCSLTDYSGKDP